MTQTYETLDLSALADYEDKKRRSRGWFPALGYFRAKATGIDVETSKPKNNKPGNKMFVVQTSCVDADASGVQSVIYTPYTGVAENGQKNSANVGRMLRAFGCSKEEVRMIGQEFGEVAGLSGEEQDARVREFVSRYLLGRPEVLLNVREGTDRNKGTPTQDVGYALPIEFEDAEAAGITRQSMSKKLTRVINGDDDAPSGGGGNGADEDIPF